MFKKLSSALVAISLVAVAQPALAQDEKHRIIISSKTDNSVSGKKGNTWTYAPGAKVAVEGHISKKDMVRVGMYCEIHGTRTGTSNDWKTGAGKGIINMILCQYEMPGEQD